MLPPHVAGRKTSAPGPIVVVDTAKQSQVRHAKVKSFLGQTWMCALSHDYQSG